MIHRLLGSAVSPNEKRNRFMLISLHTRQVRSLRVLVLILLVVVLLLLLLLVVVLVFVSCEGLQLARALLHRLQLRYLILLLRTDARVTTAQQTPQRRRAKDRLAMMAGD